MVGGQNADTADTLQLDVAMATSFSLSIYRPIWGAHWRYLANTYEPSMCGGDAALRQITLTTSLPQRTLGITFKMYNSVPHTKSDHFQKFRTNSCTTFSRPTAVHKQACDQTNRQTNANPLPLRVGEYPKVASSVQSTKRSPLPTNLGLTKHLN